MWRYPASCWLGCVLTVSACAGNWPGWRGPGGSGVAAEKGLPLHWNTNTNVAWRVPLPERGNSTPIVWGERVILTEVSSYNHLAQLISSGELTDPRTVVILSYALCGFAHVAAMAIFVGGTAALAPSRRDDLASLGVRALLAATLATLMTGCVAGIFSGGEGVLLLRTS